MAMYSHSRKHVTIFTTASLPWMTGTAIHPLFRGAFLAKDGDKDVTLVLPFLPVDDQQLVHDDDIVFDSVNRQAEYVRCWLQERIYFKAHFRIIFYQAKFCQETRSIFPVGDITADIPDHGIGVAVLEEPQHLLRDRDVRSSFKKRKFLRVIGIVHTNCATNNSSKHWVTHCDKIIRLSDAINDLPNPITCNVHGVHQIFLEEGKVKSNQLQSGENAFRKVAYYIGNMRSKGLRDLLSLLSKNQRKLSGLQLDLFVYGSEDSNKVHEAVQHLNLDVNVHPGRDHSDRLFHRYKVFIDPSTTNVVSGTTAEALGMGKFVICAKHQSNKFFRRFPNCHAYNNDKEFVRLTLNAIAEQPEPLTDMDMCELSWEQATKRFALAAGINPPSEQFIPFSPFTDMRRYNEKSWQAQPNRFI